MNPIIFNENKKKMLVYKCNDINILFIRLDYIKVQIYYTDTIGKVLTVNGSVTINGKLTIK